MRIHAVFNRQSGTFETTDMEAYCDAARSAFEACGHTFSCEAVDGRDIKQALETAAGRNDIDAMLAGGGDGTISSAAGICWKKTMPLGIVPAGTMNMFARALKLPLDIHAVLDVLARANVEPVDLATANDRPFVHQFSIGLHPRMVRFRNSYDYASRLGKIRASVRAAFGVILDPPTFTAEFETDNESGRRRVSAISVSNNPFGDDPLLFADRVDAGVLGVYIAPALKPAGVARLVSDIVRGRRRSNPELREQTTREMTIRFPRYRKGSNAVVDGELLPLDREVRLRIHAGELLVLKPATGDEADPSSGS